MSIGDTPMGGDMPIRLQSMTTTATMDTEACVAQAMRIAEAGGEYVRLTTQGTREAENMRLIREGLRRRGCGVPLVADVHFNARVADVAARYCEKVRINPGNYIDSRARARASYTDEEYRSELRRLEERLSAFLDICKENGTAVRIGVNHGSLSPRIVGRYGDTAEGIVESCMEFLRVCVRRSFTDVVVSIKASSTAVMVRSVRRLVEAMEGEGMTFPIHLGVTEAGEGEDGRMKSAVGIGALLVDGIGDTVRVSLSEAPEREIPVAREIVKQATRPRPLIDPAALPYASAPEGYDWLAPKRRCSTRVGRIGGGQVPVVLTRWPKEEYVELNPWTLSPEVIERLRGRGETIVVSSPRTGNTLGEHRALVFALWNLGLSNPVLLLCEETSPLRAAVDLGVVFIDGLADGLITGDEVMGLSILQAAGVRQSRTEYVSCPGCGRTLYDLAGTVARVKRATSHLNLAGKKIAIMGCIVNGPGEMADADYGYVGAARGRISLYRGRECVEKNIPEQEAVERLLSLIEEDRRQEAHT